MPRHTRSGLVRPQTLFNSLVRLRVALSLRDRPSGGPTGGPIPDAGTIHALKMKRQMMRDLGAATAAADEEFVPLDARKVCIRTPSAHAARGSSGLIACIAPAYGSSAPHGVRTHSRQARPPGMHVSVSRASCAKRTRSAKATRSSKSTLAAASRSARSSPAKPLASAAAP